MHDRSQSGFSLIETLVATAIVTLVVGSALFALATFGKYAAHQGGKARTAALSLAQQTLRDAQNAWKYGSPGVAPSGTQIAASVGTVTTTVAASASIAQITVRVTYTPDASYQDSGVVVLSGELQAKSPLPGAQIDRPGLVPQPAGAP